MNIFKSKREKEIDIKLENLTNEGMLDLMLHQFNRYASVTHFTHPYAIWRSWIR